VGSRTWLALCLASIGQFDEAVTWARAATGLADAADDPQAQIWASYSLGRIHCVRGHFGEALPFLERAAALSEGGRFPIYLPRVLASLGTVYSVVGRAADGLSLLERAVAEGEANRVLYGYPLVLIQLGEAHLAHRPDEAERRATRALQVAREFGERGNEALALHLLSRVAAGEPRQVEVAMAHAIQAIALATDLGMRPLIAHGHLGLGQLHQGAGTREPAREHFTSAAAMYRGMAMPFWGDQAEAGLRALD
jgi:tetratricopeptide (TPR) repeat protein